LAVTAAELGPQGSKIKLPVSCGHRWQVEQFVKL
jgi:hypothetical protein